MAVLKSGCTTMEIKYTKIGIIPAIFISSLKLPSEAMARF